MSDIKATVDYLADLARIKLEEEEKKNMAGQLSDILQAAEKIQELDTTGVEPTAHVFITSGNMRDDEVRPSLSLEEVMHNVPMREGNLVKVPRISPRQG